MNTRLPTIICFALFLVATPAIIANQNKAIAKPVSNSCIHLGRLVSIRGQVQLKRRNWSNYRPTAIGTALCQGDLLQLNRGARAIVQCADPDQNLWLVPDNIASGVASGCHLPTQPAHTITQPITPTRDPLLKHIPYIIYPHRTWLLSHKPTLRWTAVGGATNYVVRVSGPGVNWVREVNTTSIVYPGGPPLKPVEEGYLLTVEADSGGPPTKATFGLLERQQATKVQAAAKRITQANLPPEAKTLALAELYIGRGLIAEATQLLETATGSQIPAVHYLLGELYAQVELFTQAVASYQQASKLAQIYKDTEAQAMAAYRLAEVYQVLGEEDKAAYWSKQAHIVYSKR